MFRNMALQCFSNFLLIMTCLMSFNLIFIFEKFEIFNKKIKIVI